MKKREAVVITLLSLTVFLLAFLISGRLWFRLDLTRNRAYTISEVSRNLHREIDDQVTISYFVSGRLSLAHPLPGEIADLLREYAAHSRGKIRFVQKDPARAEVLRAVEELGIAPQQIQVAEKNETTIATVYSGILIEYLDREAVIPVVFSLDTLEYDLSSRIRSLIRNTEPELGVIIGDVQKQWISDYVLLNRELALSGFRVRLLRPGEEIPAGLPALFVLGGAEYLEEDDLSLIESYIEAGGNALFAVDGVFVDMQGGLEARAVNDLGLLAMLANYGVVVRPALALDRNALNLTYQIQSGNGTIIRTVRYPQWIAVQERQANPNHPVTARFRGLDLYWASPLELSPPPGVNGEVLFASTDRAWLQTGNFITNPNMIAQFGNEEAGTSGTKILGAALSGLFPGSKKTSRLIVVGDADFAGQLMNASRGEERNLEFLARAAEWLSSDDDLLAIRGREGTASRLDRISDPAERDAAMALSRSLNTIVIPLGVIVAGIIISRRRRAARERGASADL